MLAFFAERLPKRGHDAAVARSSWLAGDLGVADRHGRPRYVAEPPGMETRPAAFANTWLTLPKRRKVEIDDECCVLDLSQRSRAMIIRNVEPSDLPSLRELFLQSRRAAFWWEPPTLFELDDFDKQTKGEAIITALHGTKPVGFISFWRPDNFIHHLHVEPQLPRIGIGQALLAALPGWTAVRYRLKCVSKNRIALAFYLANGFVQIGKGHTDNQDYLLLEHDRSNA